MTSQQRADAALQAWQDLRDLPPNRRIEILMTDYFRPSIELDLRYQDQLNAVAKEMAS